MSQIAMAIPMWILFESGLLFARIVTRKPPEPSAESTA
jgi:Sec-independent protein secretion pathway component TatC